MRGSCDLVLGRLRSPALPGEAGTSLLLPGAEVHATAVVDGGTTVGARSVVAAGAEVHGSVLMDGAVVGEGAVVRDSVVGLGAEVGAGCTLTATVVGDHAVVAAGNELVAGARVWNDVRIPPDAIRFSSDRIARLSGGFRAVAVAAPADRGGVRPDGRPAGGGHLRRRAAAVRGQGLRRPAGRLPGHDAARPGRLGRLPALPAPPGPTRRRRAVAMGRLRADHGAVPHRRDRQHVGPLRLAELVGRRQPLRQLVPALRGHRPAAHAGADPPAVGARPARRGDRRVARRDLGARRVVHVHPARDRAGHGVRGHAVRRGARLAGRRHRRSRHRPPRDAPRAD